MCKMEGYDYLSVAQKIFSSFPKRNNSQQYQYGRDIILKRSLYRGSGRVLEKVSSFLKVTQVIRGELDHTQVF